MHHDPNMRACCVASFSSSCDADDLGTLQNGIRRLPSSLGMAVDSLFDDTGVQLTAAVPLHDHVALSCPSDTVRR